MTTDSFLTERTSPLREQSGAPARLGVVFSPHADSETKIEVAQRAEKLGLAELWLPDGDRDAPGDPVARAVSTATSRVVVGHMVTARHWHDPEAVVRVASGLREVSAGRLRLALDAWSAEPTVDLAAEDASSAEGRGRADAVVDALATLRTRLPDVPIHVATGDRSTLYAAGAHADGVGLGALASPAYVEWAWSVVARGARDHGRDPATIDVTADVLARVDRSSERARDRVLELLAYWLHRVEWSVIEHSGADLDRIRAVRRSVQRHGPGPALPLVTQDIVDTFAAVGDPEHVADRLAEYVRAGVRGVLAWPIRSAARPSGLRLLAEQVWPRVGEPALASA